jgi:hypothetical protein
LFRCLLKTKTEEMNELNVSRLEDLSVEIFFEIFEYLTPGELYLSVAHLNTRINSILKKQPNLIISTRNHLKPALSFFDSFMSLHIDLSRTTGSCLSQFQFLNFANIRSLHVSLIYYTWWTVITIDELNSFIDPNRCPLLESLRLSGCTTRLAEFIFTGAFRHLKVCIIETCQELVFSTSTITSVETLRRLFIHGQNENEFQKILSICPNMNYFRFNFNHKLPSFIFSNVHYPLLKYLQIGVLRDFLFHDGQFDIFLSHFPNLVEFSFSVRQCDQHGEIIDFAKVADCLRERLPRLNKLDWRIYLWRKYPYFLYINQFPLIAKMHQLFRSLRKCDSLLYITSFNFNFKYADRRYYIRPPSES